MRHCSYAGAGIVSRLRPYGVVPELSHELPDSYPGSTHVELSIYANSSQFFATVHMILHRRLRVRQVVPTIQLCQQRQGVPGELGWKRSRVQIQPDRLVAARRRLLTAGRFLGSQAEIAGPRSPRRGSGRIRSPPFGRSTTSISGSGAAWSRTIRYRCRTVAATSTSSVVARALPIQVRGPAPKTRYE